MMDRTLSRTLVASALLAAVSLGLPAPAQDLLPELREQEDEMPSGPVEEAPPEQGEDLTAPSDEPTLDILFEALADPANDQWEQTEEAIWRAWSRSGSASMDLLLRRADSAAGEGDTDLAMKFLNDLVRLAPDFAEGWNKRATLHFMEGDLGRSVADIERTLALEPRHFGALSGLAVILDRIGNKEGAFRAWRRALEIHPHLESASKGVERLEPEVEGRAL